MDQQEVNKTIFKPSEFGSYTLLMGTIQNRAVYTKSNWPVKNTFFQILLLEYTQLQLCDWEKLSWSGHQNHIPTAATKKFRIDFPRRQGDLEPPCPTPQQNKNEKPRHPTPRCFKDVQKLDPRTHSCPERFSLGWVLPAINVKGFWKERAPFWGENHSVVRQLLYKNMVPLAGVTRPSASWDIWHGLLQRPSISFWMTEGFLKVNNYLIT